MAATGTLISLDDVYRARERIGDRLHRTPLLRSATLSEQVGADVRFKAELFQRTGSFKPRGVLNKLATLTDDEKQRGVISISAGNHAQGVALASGLLGCKATVFMPQGAPLPKVEATKGYGAEVILHGAVRTNTPVSPSPGVKGALHTKLCLDSAGNLSLLQGQTFKI